MTRFCFGEICICFTRKCPSDPERSDVARPSDGKLHRGGGGGEENDDEEEEKRRRKKKSARREMERARPGKRKSEGDAERQRVILA